MAVAQEHHLLYSVLFNQNISQIPSITCKVFRKWLAMLC